MAKKSNFTVVTNKNDPSWVKMFGSLDKALAFAGPEYDKKGLVLTTFEKRTETYFQAVENEKEESVESHE